jgi:hypothetical protein
MGQIFEMLQMASYPSMSTNQASCMHLRTISRTGQDVRLVFFSGFGQVYRNELESRRFVIIIILLLLLLLFWYPL